MIPLIQARRQFIPAAETVFEVDQLDAFSLSAGTTITRSDVDLGGTGSTRHFLLGITSSTTTSGGTSTLSASLGGEAMSSIYLRNDGHVVGSVGTFQIFSLEDYTSELTADLVINSTLTTWLGAVLLRVSKVTATQFDIDVVDTNSSGTYPVNTTIPDEGVLFALGASSSTGGNSLTGPDNVIYSNQTLGHNRVRFALGWHASTTSEALATTYVAGQQTSDAHCYQAVSFGPAP